MSVFKRYALVSLFIVGSILLMGGLVYVAGLLGIERGDPWLLATQIFVTARPPLPGTPVARFAQIDPAIVPYLDNRQPSYGIIPLDALGRDIQPVGAYLPRTGNTVFDLATETPTFTPTVPTSTPIAPTPVPPVAVPATSIPPPPVSIVVVPTAVPPPVADAPPVVEAPPAAAPTAEAQQVVVEPPTLATATEVVIVNPTSPPVQQTTDCAPAGLPTSGVLTQRFHQFHIGIDIGVPLGTPLRAAQSGTVIEAGWNDIGYGNLVAIKNGAFSTYYGHQTSVNVSVGQFVRQGDIIGWSGSTGNSTGPHVHYETRINDVPVDPLTFESRGYPTC